jgi:localization factor PodJL
MRAELPWNVAGIPPEAREAARAAARREGLSVGEWLTRRILRGFSGLEEELAPMPYENRAPIGAALDSWGLPLSTASRRDTEEMMARVGRSENESNEAWRRIEDQLRGLSRRLDSNERSHGESNRAISRTAQEMNIAAREQAQAFDQLGLTVIALNERLERLERSAANDGMKDAVKALHQGLSRLADQITATANNSASQVMTLTANLEQLADRVGQARVDSEDADKALEARIDASQHAAEAGLDALSHSTDARLSSVEKTAQFNTSALDHALERIEASATQRASDQVESQKRAAQHEETMHRLEDSIARLEMRLPDADFERRLDGIERSTSSMADRLEKYDPTERFDASLQAMSHRLDALEKDHNDLLNELRAKTPPVEPPPHEEPEAEQVSQPAFEQPAIEPPPFAEPSPAPDTMPEPPPHAAEPVDAFATAPDGFAFDIPSETPTDPFVSPPEFAPEFADVFADPPEPENFLAQARRSARAASEKAESERRGRFAALGWSKEAAATEGEEKSKTRYLLPALIAGLVVVAMAAALILSQRAKHLDVTATPAPHPATATAPTNSMLSPPDSKDTQFAVAPQAGGQPQSNEKNFDTQRSEPDSQDNPPHASASLQQRDVRSIPASAAVEGAKPNGTPPSDAKVTQLANAGNPIALTILGLRALDGTNGVSVNLPDAVKFLSQAAEKGQAVAQYRLGTLYERGQGTAADPAKAAHWYEMAANQGNRKAMHNLAVSYAKKNMAEAARWFAKAAVLGLSDSQFNLAVLYERGDGVPQSLLDAYKWYSIAAAAGDSESKQRMETLRSQLNDSDKAAANKSAAIFHAAPLNRAANVPPEPADLGS